MATSSTALVSPLLSSILATSARSPPLLSFPPESLAIASSNPSRPSQWLCNPIARRRDFLAGIALATVLWKEPSASEAKDVEVGAYLPPAPFNPSFVVFKATPKDTPALRAGKSLSEPSISCICTTD